MIYDRALLRLRRPGWVWVVILCGTCVAVGGQDGPPVGVGAPQVPRGEISRSPFQSFRELLAATSAEREEVLGKKSEVHRKHLESRLREFEPLSPVERELRLKTMEVRWFLVPLLAVAPSNRVDRLSRVPEDLRRLVEDRLKKWDALPAELRSEAVHFDTTLGYIARPETGTPEEQVRMWNRTANTGAGAVKSGGGSVVMGGGGGGSGAVAVAAAPMGAVEKKRRVSEHMARFLELSSEEKQKALEGFSAVDRQQVGETLKKLESIAPAQRKLYLESFQKFSEMDEDSRRAFLKSAERWKNMPQEERRTLRELVTKLPPLPPGLDGPPLPPLPGKLTANP